LHHVGRRPRDRPGLDIDDFSRARIDTSVAELASEGDAVVELGLI
jgi:malate dehydrogenase